MSGALLDMAIEKHLEILRRGTSEFSGSLRLNEVSLMWRVTLEHSRKKVVETEQVRSLFTRFDYDHKNVSDLFSDDEFAFLAAIVMENIGELLYSKASSRSVHDLFHLEEDKRALFESIQQKFNTLKR